MVKYEVRLNGVAATASEIMEAGQSQIAVGDASMKHSETAPVGLAFIAGIVSGHVIKGLEVVQVEE